MLRYAILIDGGFAKRKIGTAKAPATAAHAGELDRSIRTCPALSGMGLHRVYYYDSLPLETAHPKPLGGGVIEFGNSPVAARSRNLFEQLSQQPFMALRLGELAFQGWEVSARRLDKAGGDAVE